MIDRAMIRKTLVQLREEEGLSQADVARRWHTTASRISRLESGEISLDDDEAAQISTAIGSDRAQAFRDYLQQDWRVLARPGFGHVSREVLWDAEQALQRLGQLENEPELKNAFLQQVRSCRQGLERSANFLLSTEHCIAFLGSPGVGKTTVICTLAELRKPGEKDLNQQMALQTGSGRTTICEVHIRRGSDYGVAVEPCSPEEIRQHVAEFCDHLLNLAADRKDRALDGAGISAELERALRNMTKLTKKIVKDSDGKARTEDPAIGLVHEYPSKEDLQVEIMARLDLARRNRTSMSFPRDSAMSGLDWLSRTCSEINYGRSPDFSLPRRMEVTIPNAILNSEDVDIRLIDTRGIDEPSSPRRDLQTYLDDERTVIALCSGFKDAPDAAMLAVIERAVEAGLAESLLARGMLLVMPQEGEESAVRDNSTGGIVSSAEEGREIRRDQVVTTTLNHQGMAALDIEFFNVRSHEDTLRVRQVLLDCTMRVRGRYEDQVRSLISTVARLVLNKADEQAKAIFESAIRPLHVWFRNNETLPPFEQEPDRVLLEEMDALRYASSLRASINRRGDWHNFDYWHSLGFGCRRETVTRSRDLVTILKGHIANALSDPDLEEAHGFLRHFQAQVDSGLNQFFQEVQTLGESAFLSQLSQDDHYWNQCHQRWGQGPGYKSDIKRWTDAWLSAEARVERRQFVESEVQRRWRDLMRALGTQLSSAGPEDERAAA
jgi:transcriptional regulator with XRE-family HTH domain